jgi:acyl-CoA thioester hydrolase
MTAAPENTYKIDLQYGPADFDGLGHINNVVYLRWVQDAAEAHWQALTKDSPTHDIAWVVLRHEIDYFLPALPEDSPYALTWVGETAGVRSVRHVRIHDRTGRLLSEASTTWCMIDINTKKAKRITDEVKSLLLKPIHPGS